MCIELMSHEVAWLDQASLNIGHQLASVDEDWAVLCNAWHFFSRWFPWHEGLLEEVGQRGQVPEAALEGYLVLLPSWEALLASGENRMESSKCHKTSFNMIRLKKLLVFWSCLSMFPIKPQQVSGYCGSGHLYLALLVLPIVLGP